jgi:hypothetical protein
MSMTSHEPSTSTADVLTVLYEAAWELRHVVAAKLVEGGAWLMIAGAMCQAAGRKMRRDSWSI